MNFHSLTIKVSPEGLTATSVPQWHLPDAIYGVHILVILAAQRHMHVSRIGNTLSCVLLPGKKEYVRMYQHNDVIPFPRPSTICPDIRVFRRNVVFCGWCGVPRISLATVSSS
jgi:hypothetical protein